MTIERPMFPPAIAGNSIPPIGGISAASLNDSSAPNGPKRSPPGQPAAARSSMSRRMFMSVFGSATLAPTLTASSPALPIVIENEAEDPAIVEIGERIEPLLAAYRNLTVKEAEAFATFERLRPAAPEELFTAHEKYHSLRDCRTEWNDGRGFREPEIFVGDDGKTYARPPRRILSSKLLRIFIIEKDIGRTSKHGREIRRLARLALNYERAVQKALDEAGCAELEDERRWSAYQLEHLVYELRERTPKSMVGVLIFARALSAFGEAELCAGKIIGGSAQILGQKLATAMLGLGKQRKYSASAAKSSSPALAASTS